VAYENFRRVLKKHLVHPEALREIMEVYAVDTVEAYPDAFNSVSAARRVADEICDALEET
jgi:predicted urease superfamily metal-dependent hydrolase